MRKERGRGEEGVRKERGRGEEGVRKERGRGKEGVRKVRGRGEEGKVEGNFPNCSWSYRYIHVARDRP